MVEIGSWTRNLCLGDPISLPLHHEVTRKMDKFYIRCNIKFLPEQRDEETGPAQAKILLCSFPF
jgi:hypothetical protein